jgi:predicted permease
VRVNDALKGGARGNTGDRAQHRLQQTLIVSQFASALILLACAVGFIRGVSQLTTVHPGWDESKIIQAVLNLPTAKYPTPQQTYAFYSRLEERLHALPGAENVTVAWTLPVFQYLTSRSIAVEGQPPATAGHEPVASINAVTPSYFATLGIKLQAGRNFTDADTLDSLPVAIINASLAKALFPGESAVGHRIGSPDPRNPGWYEIVGVVPDVERAIGAIPATTHFLLLRPLAQETWNYVTVAIRSSNPAALTESMRRAIAALDPDLAVQQFGTIEQVTRLVTGVASMITTVLVCFALLGLFLAALGLYGVIARIVVSRSPEIGVRIALGAQANDVVRMILFSGLRMILIGSGIGVALAVLIGWVLQKVSPGAAPVSGPLLLGVVGVLIAVGLFACWLPARRASRVDPLVALRAE